MNDPLLPLDHGGPTERPYSPLKPSARQGVASCFLDRAERHGDALALQDHRQALSYRALRQRVEATLQLLLAQPAGAGDQGPIAILCAHEADFAVAMLAALWLGRPYVPLDPLLPDARKASILEHSGAELVLAQAGLLEGAASLAPGLPRVAIAAAPAGGTPAKAAALPAPAGPERLAYILYTSGSTGLPKGVFQSQRGLLHDVGQYIDAAHIAGDDRLSLLYSLSALGSLRDLFGALLAGASAHFHEPRKEGAAGLLAFLRDRRISLYHSFPAIFRSLTDLLSEGERLESLRLVYLAGDRIDAADLDRFRRHLPPGALLYLGIGSTECSTLHRHWFLTHDSRPEGDRLPVGRRLPDRRISLVDPEGREVAPGERGEILVAGRSLALGYWRDPARTAERFGPDPEDPLGRCFRTGDRGRLRPDGLLEFWGRADSLVKIGGHLVDPSEIEAALRARPEVAEAAIVLLDAATAPRLVACLVARPGCRLDSESLHGTLARHFPASALPIAYHRLESLPQTPNGKLDRRALEALVQELGRALDDSPRTALERQLCAIWATSLKRERVGIRDHYFASLGGDSLGALALVQAVEQGLGRPLPPMTLFRLATVADMAQAIESLPGRPRHPAVEELQPFGTAPPLFFAPGLGEPPHDNLLHLTRHLDDDQPAFGIQDLPPRPGDPYAASLEELAAGCVATLLSFQPEGPHHLAGYSFGGRLAFAMAQRLQDLGRPVGLLAILDCSAALFRRRSLRPLPDPPSRRESYRCLSERYVPRPYAGDILYVQAATRWEGALLEPDGGWGSVTSGRVRTLVVEGRHRDLALGPQAGPLAKQLGRLIAEAEGRARALAGKDEGSEDPSREQRLAAKRAEIAGDLEAEIEAYRRAFLLRPEQPLYAHLNLWEALRAAGRKQGATAAFRRARAAFGEQPAFYYRAAQTLRLAGELEAARQLGKKARALGCDSPALMLERALLELDRERPEAAVERFHEVLARDPLSRPAASGLSQTLRRLGRKAERRRYAEHFAALRRAARAG